MRQDLTQITQIAADWLRVLSWIIPRELFFGEQPLRKPQDPTNNAFSGQRRPRSPTMTG